MDPHHNPEIARIMAAKTDQEGADELTKLFQQGKKLQQAFGYSETQMRHKYAYGFDLFQNQRFTEAATIFSHLAALNPLVKKYWMALAVSQVRGMQRELALASLGMATLLDPEDPRPHYHSALCYVTLDKESEAMEAFEQCLEKARGKQEYFTVEQEALEWVDKLKGQK